MKNTCFKQLQEQALEANLRLKTEGLVMLTWGNASAVDRNAGIIAIKPSGVAYDKLAWQDMVLLDFDGNVIDSKLKPSSDTATHIELYKGFPNIGGIVHTHSRWATVWAQSLMPIPALGTTHADHFYGAVPCIPSLSKEEVVNEYEKSTGAKIVKEFESAQIDPLFMPACLVANHGPFTWGKSVNEAVNNAVALEECANMAHHTLYLNKDAELPAYVLEKHYSRKHGPNAYYGQKRVY